MKDNLVLFAGSYGFAQRSMIDIGLLNHQDGNQAKKNKHLTAIEQDGMGIYET